MSTSSNSKESSVLEDDDDPDESEFGIKECENESEI
jgi:hypothetical protein